MFAAASMQPSNVKGFYDYLCQEEIKNCSCLISLSQVYCIELCNIPALSKKKKKNSLEHNNSTDEIL